MLRLLSRFHLVKALGKNTDKQLMPLLAGDLLDAYSSMADLVEQIQLNPATVVKKSISRFVAWYRKELNRI